MGVKAPTLAQLAGAQIKLRRTRLGWTASDLGNRMGGVDRQTVYTWEKGQRLPRDKTLQSLCALFGCEMHELIAPLPIIEGDE